MPRRGVPHWTSCLNYKPQPIRRLFPTTCSKCLCINVDVQYESKCVKCASLMAWPWCPPCSEFRPSGLGLAALSSLMTGLNAQWQRQLVPTYTLTLDSLAHCVSAWLSVCKCQKLLSSHQFPLSLVSTPLQAEKYLSSNSLQTTTVLNLIKDITDNRGAIKQQCFQHPTGAYIPLAQRVTAVSFISQLFFKAISLLCVLPPPPHPVNQVMLVAWGKSFIRNVFYRWLWMRIALVGLQVNKRVKRECRSYWAAAQLNGASTASLPWPVPCLYLQFEATASHIPLLHRVNDASFNSRK